MSMVQIAQEAKRLRAERMELIESAREILDRAESEQRKLSADEEQRYEHVTQAAEGMMTTIERLESATRDSLLGALDRTPRSNELEDRGGVVYRDMNGNQVRSLAPSERLSDVCEPNLPDGIRPSDLDFGRYLRGLVTGNWHGAEAEERAMTVSVDAAGGHLVPEPLSNAVIDLSRNESQVLRAGARTLPMESSTLKLAAVTADATSEWHAENAPITASDVAFGPKTLTAKTLVAMTPMSVELIEDSPNAGDVVQRSLSESLGLALDLGLLRGSGSGAEMLGIRGTTGVQILDLGTNGAAIDLDDFSQAAEMVRSANGRGQISAIYAPRTWGQIDRQKDGNGRYLSNAGPESWQQMRRFSSGQVPIDLTHGTETAASEAYVGVFNEVLVGMRTRLTIEISREATDAASGLGFSTLSVLIRAYLRADMIIARPSHMVVIDGIAP
ncbi:MAG: phage major capsid protein [bacterium]|nr:phage major capsid protein [bacterium]